MNEMVREVLTGFSRFWFIYCRQIYIFYNARSRYSFCCVFVTNGPSKLFKRFFITIVPFIRRRFAMEELNMS